MGKDLGISPEEIIYAAEEAGFSVSIHQLKRWRDSGLIASPSIIGLGRGKGTKSFYPKGTIEQVVALCQILQQDRRLDLALVALFFQNFQVSFQALRDLLNKTSKQWEETFKGLIGIDGLTEEGFLEIEKLSHKRRIPKPSLGNARRRLRISKFESFARILFFVAAGVRPDTLWNSPEPELEIRILRRGLSMDDKWRSKAGLRNIAKIINEKIWTDLSDEELSDSIFTIADHFKPAQIRATIQNTTDKELTRARDELLRICKIIQPVSKLLNKFTRKDSFGLGALSDLDLKRSDPIVPGMFLGWLQVRHIADTPINIQTMLETEIESEKLERLLEDQPETVEYLIREFKSTKSKG